MGTKEFEGDGPAEFQILSAKNDPHATGPELFLLLRSQKNIINETSGSLAQV
jgi:hypothetical protein